MSDAAQTFLHIGPNAGLGADEHQWILYRAGQPVSYVRSTKAVLVRCIREKGIELSAEGKAALDALADDFNAWKADPTRRGTPVAAEASGSAKNIDADASGRVGGPPVGPRAEMPLAGASDVRVAHSEARGGVRLTMIEELGPKLAIGTDGLQWIVLKRKGERWRACGFVHSDKRALIACIAAKGLKLSAAGRAALNRQGDRIWRWRTYGDGVRQTIGACGQAQNPAMEIGIDAQVEGGCYPVPGLAANSADRDMSPTQKLEALV
jgi:hypothetical protein